MLSTLLLNLFRPPMASNKDASRGSQVHYPDSVPPHSQCVGTAVASLFASRDNGHGTRREGSLRQPRAL